MRRMLWLFVGAASLFAADYAAEGKLWWSHIQYLADDKLEGRDVGSEGFKKAVEYVSTQFERIGLKPGGENGYQQPIKFEKRTLIADQSSLTLVRDGNEIPLALGADANFNTRANLAPSVEAPMVFVGHAFAIPESKIDDLKGLDLRGKIAVYMSAGSVPGVPGNLMSHYQSASERWNALKRAGAIGIATVQAPPQAGRGGNGANPAQGDAAGGARGGRGAAPSTVIADPALQETGGQQISLTITSRGAEKLFEGTGHTLDELQKIAKANQPLPTFELKGQLRAKAAVTSEPLDSQNVVGVLPGSDAKLKNEYIVMSAHLDHLGVGRAVNGDSIYNGAMDDASGVASVIEIARLMKESGAKLKRSVIFLTVTGEEKGELGRAISPRIRRLRRAPLWPISISICFCRSTRSK